MWECLTSPLSPKYRSLLLRQAVLLVVLPVVRQQSLLQLLLRQAVLLVVLLVVPPVAPQVAFQGHLSQAMVPQVAVPPVLLQARLILQSKAMVRTIQASIMVQQKLTTRSAQRQILRLITPSRVFSLWFSALEVMGQALFRKPQLLLSRNALTSVVRNYLVIASAMETEHVCLYLDLLFQPPIRRRTRNLTTLQKLILLLKLQKMMRHACSASCPTGNGHSYASTFGETFRLNCGKRYGTTYLKKDQQETLKDCMDSCAAFTPCHNVDYHEGTQTCYYPIITENLLW